MQIGKEQEIRKQPPSGALYELVQLTRLEWGAAVKHFTVIHSFPSKYKNLIIRKRLLVYLVSTCLGNASDASDIDPLVST